MRIIIRKLGYKEIVEYQEAIESLIKICFKITYGEEAGNELVAEKYKSLIEHAKVEKAYVYGATIDHSLMGFLWGYPVKTPFKTVFHIAYIAVFEQGRRKGIGRELLRAAEKQTLELGLERMELIVGALNDTAEEFYGKSGYQVCRKVLSKSVK